MYSFHKVIANTIGRLIAKGVPLVAALTLAFGPTPASARDRTPPTKPSNFRVTAKTAYTVTVAWGSSTDNSGHFTYLLADTGSGQRVTLPQTATSYTFKTDLFPRNTYTFIIAAVDAAGNGSQSVSVSATLPADTTPPTTAPVLSATDVGATHASLAWTAAQDDAPYLYYEIFLNGAPYAYAGTNLSDALDSLQPGTTYTFNVQAQDLGGNLSPISNPVTVTTATAATDTTPPTTPANFGDYGMTFQDGETWLFWDQSTDDQTPQSQIRYDVYFNGVLDGSLVGSGGPWILYANLGALNTFEVIAVDEEGNQSAPATFTLDLR